MADRKQGAGLSSGSSEAVHKVNWLQWKPNGSRSKWEFQWVSGVV